MTRANSGDRVKFGPAEWVAVIALLLTVAGAWIDMSAQNRVNTEIMRRVERLVEDHEMRIRDLEHENRRPAAGTR